MDLTTYATFKFERRGRLLRAAFNSPGTLNSIGRTCNGPRYRRGDSLGSRAGFLGGRRPRPHSEHDR